jgi:hypothetical protein
MSTRVDFGKEGPKEKAKREFKTYLMLKMKGVKLDKMDTFASDPFVVISRWDSYRCVNA